MTVVRKHNRIFLIAMLVTVMLSGFPVMAYQVVVTPEVRIENDCDKSEAELTIRITIPKGTPLGAQADAIDQLMAFFKSIWTGTNPVLTSITDGNKQSVDADIALSSQAISGVDAILSVNRAFRQVEERGYVSFPEELTLISSEKFPLQIKCLLNGKNGQALINPRVEEYSDINRAEYKRKCLVKNLNNMAVTLVSFRSEYGRFPNNFEELKQSGHLLVAFENPLNNMSLKFSGEKGPGTMTYTRPSEGRFILTIYDYDNLPIRRELIVGPDFSVRGVLSIDKPAQDASASFTKKEQTVRISIFQTGQLLNSFYETYHYLPKSVPHIEAQGFGSVNFVNPFTGKPIEPSMRIDSGKPGEYWYWVIDDGEYLLVGFGENGRKVIEVHRKFVGNLKDK